MQTCLGFELLPIRDNLLGTLTFVRQDGATRVNALEEAAMIKNAQPLTLQGVRLSSMEWLGGRDSTPFTTSEAKTKSSRSELRCRCRDSNSERGVVLETFWRTVSRVFSLLLSSPPIEILAELPLV